MLPAMLPKKFGCGAEGAAFPPLELSEVFGIQAAGSRALNTSGSFGE